MHSIKKQRRWARQYTKQIFVTAFTFTKTNRLNFFTFTINHNNMETQFTCHQCGETKTHASDISTGYGIDAEDNKICFSCCGVNDAKQLSEMPIGGKAILYLDTNKKTLSNWPGSFKIQLHAIREGRHNMAGKRFDAWFDYKGNEYHAVQYGTNTQIAHIKRI